MQTASVGPYFTSTTSSAHLCILLVKDCEVIRQALLGDRESPEDRKWSLMGQSFGGFCAITYLSFHYQGVKEVFITGGLAPLVDQPDVVYEALCRKQLLLILSSCRSSEDLT